MKERPSSTGRGRSHGRRSRLGDSVNRLLVILWQGLGDVVLATPALRALRARFPEARLCLAGKPGSIGLLSHEPYIDELLPLPANSAGWSAARAWWDATAAIRDRRFDLIIDLTTPLRPATLAKASLLHLLCRPRRLIAARRRDCIYVGLRRERVRYRLLLHEAALKFHLLRRLLPMPTPPRPRLTIVPGLAGPLQAHLPADVPRIGVAAGGARQSRQWPVEQFVATLQAIRRRGRFAFVLLGDENDRPITSRLRAAVGDALDLAGRVPVHQLPSLLADLQVLVCNDSGLMHIAAAVGTPLVAILGAEDPARYAPLAAPHRMAVFYRRVACAPCLRERCSHRSCTAWIAPEAVADAVARLLAPPLGDRGTGIDSSAGRSAGRCDGPGADALAPGAGQDRVAIAAHLPGRDATAPRSPAGRFAMMGGRPEGAGAGLEV